MHHYGAILRRFMQAETQLNEAMQIAAENRGRGVADEDVVRIAEARDVVNEQYSWFKRSFENRI